MNALPIVANAAPDTSEWRYVLEVTGNIIEKNQTATMETNEVTVYLNRIKDCARSALRNTDNIRLI